MINYKLFTILFLLTSPLIFSQSSIKHSVSKGESIYGIAKKYHVKESSIYELNPALKGKLLQLKTVVLIHNYTVEGIEKYSDTTKTHIVKSGETLYKISRKYGIPIKELERLNPSVLKKLPVKYELTLREEVPKIEIATTEIEDTFIVNDTVAIIEEPSQVEFLIESASKYLGVRYRRGGTSTKGFDCSGLMFNTFKEINITLPRSSHQQSKIGTKKEKSQAQKGDLIFFATKGKGIISHVGMITEILGDEIKFIHSSTQLGVIISSTKEPYYSKRFIQINNVL